VLREGRPVALDADVVTLEFPASAGFHARLAAEPKNADLLAQTLERVAGRPLRVEFVVGDEFPAADAVDEPVGEQDLVELVKQTFDAREIDA
jgi:hypothetical protein